MAQIHKVGKTATKVKVSGSELVIEYHETEVVKANDCFIILNTGGWFTVTTKTRMNQASNEFSLGYSVYQKKGFWYVDYKGKTYLFNDEVLTLER
jgi:hypothetical protein